MTAETGLKWLLRFMCLTTLFAFFAAVMPQSWVAYWINKRGTRDSGRDSRDLSMADADDHVCLCGADISLSPPWTSRATPADLDRWV